MKKTMMVVFTLAVCFLVNAVSSYALMAQTLVSRINDTKKVAFAYPVMRYPFYLYQDAGSRINNFVLSGWTGDFRALKIDSSAAEDQTLDNTCLRVRFIPFLANQAAYGKQAPDMMTRHGYAGFAIQANPENHWGSLRGGYDMSKAKKLFLFARGKNGGEKIEVGMRRKNSSEMTATAGIIELTKEWRIYEVNLGNLSFNESAGGVYVLVHGRDKVLSAEVFIDEIYITRDTTPSVTMEDGKFLKERI